jgi:hypothetical protein
LSLKTIKYKSFFLICFLLLGFAIKSTAQQDSTEIVDSVKTQKKRNIKFTSGELSVGYEYGFLPFSMLLSPPDQNIKSTGQLNFEIRRLPFNVNYYYSSLGFLSGINNHFSVKFDVHTYLNNLREDILAQKIKRSFEIDSLQQKKQALSTQLDYLKTAKTDAINAEKLKNKKKYFPPPPDGSLDTSQLTQHINTDTLTTNKKDSTTSPIPDTSNIKNKTKPTRPNNVDSLDKAVVSLENKITEVDRNIAELKKLNNNTSFADDISSDNIPFPEEQSNFEKFLLSIRTLEVGLTSPDFSEFLVSRTMVRGINTEFQHKDYYLAFVYGTAINTILNSQLNQPNVGEQFYNFLSIKNVDSGRKITSLKVGYGEKESSHIYAGILYGMGKLNYSESPSLSQNNLVAEIDGRIKFLKHHTFDIVYGRSALQVENVLGNDESLLMALFNFKSRTNAVLSRYKLKFKGTSFELKYRLIDPFYKSYGVQFIRNDNIRYEAKLKQKLSKKITIGGFARRENDNLLGIHTNENVFLSYGADIAYRPTKKLLLKADYRPFVQQVNSIADTGTISNNNFIVNTVASYNNRIKKTFLTITGVYSYYSLASVNGNEIFRNYNLNLNLQFKKKISNAIIYNRFDATEALITLNNILENDFSIQIKKFTITGIGKVAFNDNNSNLQSGYGLKLGIPIIKKTMLELTGEKLLLGDFYSNLLSVNIEEFPYYFSGNLIFRF